MSRYYRHVTRSQTESDPELSALVQAASSAEKAATSSSEPLKSYTPEETAAMKERAAAILKKGTDRPATIKWPVADEVLKQRVESLNFFADKELNQMVKDILIREDCMQSIKCSVRKMGRIFWSEEDWRKSSFRLLNRKRESSLADKKDNQAPHLLDFHQLLMYICDMDLQQWNAPFIQQKGSKASCCQLVYNAIQNNLKYLKDKEEAEYWKGVGGKKPRTDSET